MPAPQEGSRFSRLRKTVRDATGINGFRDGREVERSNGHGRGAQLTTGVIFGSMQVAMPMVYRELDKPQGEIKKNSRLKDYGTILADWGMVGAFVGALYLLGPIEAVGVRLVYGASVSALPEVKKSISERLSSQDF